MKKAILPLVFSVLAIGAVAQTASTSVAHSSLYKKAAKESAIMGKTSDVSAVSCMSTPATNFQVAHKTTAAPFWTENFSSGTSSTLPNLWSDGSASGSGKWMWVNSFPATPTAGSAYTIGPIKTPASVSNGWMVYNSDSIAGVSGATALTANLVSPLINCSAQSTVLLSFYEWYRKYNDSCFIDVTSNGGVSWTTYANFSNNTISDLDQVPSNPYMVRMNISAAAANHSNVQIRFRYVYSGPAGGGYSWHVDDVALSPLDPNDLGIQNSYPLMAVGGNGVAPIGIMPLQLVDTLFPMSLVSSYGSAVQNNVSVSASILTTPFTTTTTVATVPVNAIDTLVDFTSHAGYMPTATGTGVMALSLPADGYLLNNNDTCRYGVSDTVLSGITPSSTSSGAYYLHRTSGTTTDFRMGIAFVIPAGKHDTLTSFTAAFENSTQPGANVVAQLYKLNSTGNWDFIVKSKVKTLTASDISTSTTTVYTSMLADVSSSGGLSTLDLQPGEYTVLIGSEGASDTVLILARKQASDPNNNSIGVIGRTCNAANDANTNLTIDTAQYSGLSSIPVLYVNFGNNAAQTLGVSNISFVTVGEAYPNPANNAINIPFSTVATADVHVSVTNITGQILKNQTFSNAKVGTAKFSTSDLSNGIYFYTVEASGAKNTGRFVVTH